METMEPFQQPQSEKSRSPIESYCEMAADLEREQEAEECAEQLISDVEF